MSELKIEEVDIYDQMNKEYMQLYNDISNLNELQNQINQLFYDQGERLQFIEESVQNTVNTTTTTLDELQEISDKLKYPVMITGLITGSITGSIGILCGLKIGAVVLGIGGSAFGAYFGKFL